MEPFRPHIALFSFAYAPFFGGAETALSEITRRLGGQFRFTCFTYRFDDDTPREEVIDGVRVIRVRALFGSFNKLTSARGIALYWRRMQKMFYIPIAFFLAWRVHRSDPFHMTWAMMAAYGGATALLFKLCFPHIPFFLTLQEGDDEAYILRRVGIYYPLWKLIFKKANHIQVISRYLRVFASRYGATCGITIVPNGVIIERNVKRETCLPVGTARNGLGEKIIITTSRLVYKNAVDVIIRAVSELKTMTSEPFNLQIVGDGPLRSELEQLARQLNIADIVQFIGAVRPSEISNYLASAYVFVRPSRSEGLGSSFIEAMAAGVPIIATSVGGIPDFLHDRETGLFVCVDDPHDLAEKVFQLLRDNSLYERLSKNAFELVRRDYQWDTIAMTMGKLFTQTMHD